MLFFLFINVKPGALIFFKLKCPLEYLCEIARGHKSQFCWLLIGLTGAWDLMNNTGGCRNQINATPNFLIAHSRQNDLSFFPHSQLRVEIYLYGYLHFLFFFIHKGSKLDVFIPDPGVDRRLRRIYEKHFFPHNSISVQCLRREV